MNDLLINSVIKREATSEASFNRRALSLSEAIVLFGFNRFKESKTKPVDTLRS